MAGKSNKIAEEKDWRMHVFDSLSFPTLILNPDRTIVSVNQVFLKKFGEMKGVIGRMCYKAFYELDEPCTMRQCPLIQVLNDGKPRSLVIQTSFGGGAERWEERVFSPILDEEERIVYIMESIRDVTRIKTLEKELRETKEFFEEVLQSSPSAIVAANRTGEILFMNRAAEDLFGYRMQYVLGKMNVEEVYAPGKAREIMRMLRDESIGGKGKLPPAKVDIIDAYGESIPVEITAAIIYEGTEEVATMGIYNDLRERLAVERKLKDAQNRLMHSEKMASLGQLAAGVAHELNNPLTGILLYLNMVLERLDPGIDYREDLECVLDDANRCKNIIKNLLAYSRQAAPDKEVFELNSLVEQGLGLIRDQKLFINISVKRELSDEMMLIHADKNQLSQVIINLVMNAIDAMEKRGALTFRTYRNKPARKVYVEISDTGGGISEESISKVFDPFYTTKGAGKGTGLGLSTAYGIVKENGGEISIKDTRPEGTTFLIELPLFVPENGDPES